MNFGVPKRALCNLYPYLSDSCLGGSIEGRVLKTTITGRGLRFRENAPPFPGFTEYTYTAPTGCLGDRGLMAVMMDPYSIYEQHIKTF